MKNNKFQLFASIIQLIFGSAAIVSFIILAVGGEDMRRWTVTLILAFGLVVLGAMGINAYKKQA